LLQLITTLPILDADRPSICRQVKFPPISPPPKEKFSFLVHFSRGILISFSFVPYTPLATDSRVECQQSNPRPYASYASGPNDVWSLGVILVNLCCGRNPWKRASTEDSTFRAFLRDPQFLRSILPLSPELNSILRRIFECDPHKRINLPELRRLIVECPRFTLRSGCTYSVPPSPRHSLHYVKEPFELFNYGHYRPQPSASPIEFVYSLSAVSDASLSDDDSSLSSSSSSSSEYVPENPSSDQFRYVAPPIPTNFWGSFIPFDVGEKTQYHQPLEPIIADA
jgi:serine/threonine protein kinase